MNSPAPGSPEPDSPKPTTGRTPQTLPPTDTRAERRTLDRNLAWAVIIFLVGVGGLLIALIYGAGPAVLGLSCLLGGAALFGLLWLILTLLQRWAGGDR
jgi:hypothetical protein